MPAVAAHRSDGRGARAPQPQPHRLSGSPSEAIDEASNLLTSRPLDTRGYHHILRRPIGDEHLRNHRHRHHPHRWCPQPLVAASCAAAGIGLVAVHVNGQRLFETVTSTLNQADQTNSTTFATAMALAATGRHHQQLQAAPPPTPAPPLLSPTPPAPSLSSFTGWEWLLITVLISIILISIIGNCLVCVAIFTDRRLRKLGNAFIVSLAIADLFVSCLVMTFALCNDLMNYWMFGEWFCDIWISFDIMCSTASILNLCAISLDRFIHIKDCLLYNQLMTKRVAISAVIVIWIISALVSFVPINLGWHKPNHFKQALNGTTGDAANHHFDLLAASMAEELAPELATVGADHSRRAHVADSDAMHNDHDDYEGALDAENKRLALIGHERPKLDSGLINDRYKRQLAGEAQRSRAPELGQRFSEIRSLPARSRIAEKLLEPRAGEIPPSTFVIASDGGRRRLANLADGDAQVSNRSRELEGAGHESNNLRRQPTARSNDGGGGRSGAISDGDDDDDVSKQSSSDPLELHKNELPDQVAAPSGKFNLALLRQRGERHAEPKPAERIKHFRADPSRPPQRAMSTLNAARLAPHDDADDPDWQLAGLDPARDREHADRPNASSNVDKPNARRHDKIRTETTSRWRRQAQSGADEPEATKLNDPLGSRRLATTTLGTGSGTSSTSSTNPANPTTPNELPQCMLTLTPTYAVISSTISFYIPCIIMLGLYSKLFACARRHVRNIKAISKAPQPIGFGGSSGQTTVERRLDSTIGRPAMNAPGSANTTAASVGFGAGDSNRGEIINCRRPPASNRQHQTTNSLLLSSSQTVPTVTNTTATTTSSAASTANNNEQPTTTSTSTTTTGNSNSLGSQCRANLARFVRRPERKLAPDSRSRTWIKFGRQPVGAGALKSGARAPKSELVESVSSTAAKLLPQSPGDAQAASLQKIAPKGGGLMMKLNNGQNARSRTESRQTDCNDDAGAELLLPSDNNNNNNNGNDNSETIAHGNETEPFLSGRDPGKRQSQPEVDQANPSGRLAAVLREELAASGELGSGGESSQPDDTIPSRETNASGEPTPQILSATSTAFTSASPFKSSNNNHAHQHQELRHLGGSWRKHLQSQQNKQQTNQLATHKAAITLGIIMGTFLFCWVPFFCLNIIKAFHGDSIPSSLFRAFTWLGYVNSALNPIIYGIHNSEFRNAFNRIFFKHLTLKNGRQYLNRRFSYDLRPHNANQHEQTRWLNNIHNQTGANTSELRPQRQRPLSSPTPIETRPLSHLSDHNEAHHHHN